MALDCLQILLFRGLILQVVPGQEVIRYAVEQVLGQHSLFLKFTHSKFQERRNKKEEMDQREEGKDKRAGGGGQREGKS